MKGVWKIFEFDLFDVLVCKTFSERDQEYALEFSICVEVGNTATVSLKYQTLAEVNTAFEKQSADTVSAFADYIIESLGGRGIFEGDGPDEIEATLSTPIKLQ